MKRSVIARRCSQAIFLILFIYILWSTTYPLKGLLPPDTFFKIDPLVMSMTSISERFIIPGLWLSLIMIVATIVVGRFFCGWICPLGAMIDIAGLLKKGRRPENNGKDKRTRRIKFYLLASIAFAAFGGTQIAWILDPMVIMARFVSLNLIPAATLLVNNLFIFLIKDLGMQGALLDFYRSLKGSVLGIHAYYFSHSFVILTFFLFVMGTTFIASRFWCRALCPLGALYACAARFAVLRRVVGKCIRCGRCKSDCRMGAIKDDLDYVKGECVLCMDCVYNCPGRVTRFAFSGQTAPETPRDGGKGALSRRDFLVLLGSSLFLLGFRRADEKDARGLVSVIRPPAALREEEFLNTCIRCGNCMKVCITNGLQPVMLQSGPAGIWTPHLVPEIGYCEYNCTLCGNTCPTGAITPLGLAEKQRVSLGLAEVDRSICIAWAENKECIVCEEHCPVAQKAIKFEEYAAGGTMIQRPYVASDLCIGCGICQNKCPVRPTRAIRVTAINAYRPSPRALPASTITGATPVLNSFRNYLTKQK